MRIPAGSSARFAARSVAPKHGIRGVSWNGRIGRLLITLLLERWKLLSQPLLYLSLFFKQHRAEH